MSLTYSKYLHVSHRSLISKGVYNGALDQDYELHIDPLLLKTCDIPEFKGAHEEFIAYFRKFVTLAPFVKEHKLPTVVIGKSCTGSTSQKRPILG